MAVLAIVTGFVAAVAVARDPAPESVFRRHLKTSMPTGISDAQACVRWVFADPAYYVRFRADRATIEQLVWDLKLHEDDPPKPVSNPGGFGGPPGWWKPSELGERHSWHSSGGGPFIDLYADLERGIGYLILTYT
jgi:hypothetical protein